MSKLSKTLLQNGFPEAAKGVDKAYRSAYDRRKHEGFTLACWGFHINSGRSLFLQPHVVLEDTE